MTELPLAGGVPSIPEFRPVERNVFAARAQRLRALAPGHALEAYLQFAGAIAAVQDTALTKLESAGTLATHTPNAAELERCRTHGLPPLSIDAPRDAAWRDVLISLLEALDRRSLPSQASATVAALRSASATALELDATRVLAGAFADIEPARLPFIGAALQVGWTARALALGKAAHGPNVGLGLCPVCGSPPVVSAVRSGGAQQGLRYLVCSLCASEWHVVRVKCTACGSTKGISYLFVEGTNDAVKAECCDACNAYLKILYLDKDNRMEPIADDLATIALDVLVDEQGYRRTGPNLLLAPGGGAG